VASGTIDADVHDALPSLKVLLPYLPEQWHPYILEYGWQTTSIMPYFKSPTSERHEWTPETGPRGSDPELLKKNIFDDLGIGIPILNNLGSFTALTGWYELAAALCRATNDYMIERILDPEPRFRGSVYVHPHDAVQAAAEIDRVGGHPQMVQVFMPIVTDRELGDPMYRPIYEAAVRNNLVVAFHHGAHTKSVLGYARYFIDWHSTALHQAMQCQLSSILYNGTFDLFPELKVICLETAWTWMSSFMTRCDRQYDEFRHEVPWVKRQPSEHFREHVRLVTHPMEQLTRDQFLKYLDLMGTDEMLLYASDYPHHDTDLPDYFLPGGLPDELRLKILRNNAIATYPKFSSLAPATA
jgi:predicted TIM-barrel fold metal-dependent hydrolase